MRGWPSGIPHTQFKSQTELVLLGDIAFITLMGPQKMESMQQPFLKVSNFTLNHNTNSVPFRATNS